MEHTPNIHSMAGRVTSLNQKEMQQAMVKLVAYCADLEERLRILEASHLKLIRLLKNALVVNE